LIKFQKNLEDKHRQELEQTINEHKQKILDIRKKHEISIQKALTQQKEEMESSISQLSGTVDRDLQEKNLQNTELLKQRSKEIAQLENTLDNLHQELEDKEVAIKLEKQKYSEIITVLELEHEKNNSKYTDLDVQIKNLEEQLSKKKRRNH